jgi:hypothetical protein
VFCTGHTSTLDETLSHNVPDKAQTGSLHFIGDFVGKKVSDATFNLI